MLLKLKRNNWRWLKIILVVLAVIPIGITVFQLLSTEEKTIVFLEGFHPIAAVAIEVYYLLLILAGLIWGIMQLKSIFQLRHENRKNELLHLQSQVNPHFFFNTLNNLYGLVDLDTERAKELILKLSELMRYSIYEGERKTVALSEEIAYLENYIELHSMRYQKGIDLKFNIEIEEKECQIMPLLFIILLENAFKHGLENLRDEAFVHIDLVAKNGIITFEVNNNFDPAELPQKAGIGLQNLKRRLALAYPQRHALSIEKKENIYKAKLRLEL